ncbi:MAG: hypothetical protein ACE5DI_05950 [Candidatus Micrarchaeia archaeon]
MENSKSSEGFVSKKIPKRAVPKLRRLQARLMLRRGKKVSEATLFEELLDLGLKFERKLTKKEKQEESFFSNLPKPKKRVPKFDAEKEIDKVVYGI